MTTARKSSVYAARIISETALGLIAVAAIGFLCLAAAQAQTSGHAAGSSATSPSSSAPPPTVSVPAQPGPNLNSSSPNTMSQSPEAPVSPSTPGVVEYVGSDGGDLPLTQIGRQSTPARTGFESL
jgi:hypothetical protein